ncbi:MAG TPA: peptidylprolyl isomerase [Pirellulales bacterium]
MARSFYSIVLCITLVVLATMCWRPGIAQDLLALANSMRAQSPDPNSASGAVSGYTNPRLDPYGGTPNGNTYGAPNQPTQAIRPASWPGGPGPGNNPNGVNAGVVNDYAGNAPTGNVNPAAGNRFTPTTPVATAPAPGVTVWAPPGAAANGYQVAQAGAMNTAQPPSSSPTQSTPPAAQFGGAIQPAISANATQSASGYPTNPIPPLVAQPQTPAGAEMQGMMVFPAKPEAFGDAQVVAKIGTSVVLASDINAMVADFLNKNYPDLPADQKEEVYSLLRRKMLKQVLDSKLVCNDAIHTVPAAAMTKIESGINKEFDEKQMPQLMKDNNAAGRQDLDVKLRAKGTSIDHERRIFFEQMLAIGWVQQQVKTDEEISLGAVSAFYLQHATDYDYQAQARWEELMVTFDKFPDKNAAKNAIAEMGNAVMRGTPFAEVAKAHSQGFTADKGGTYDWTTPGSLAAKNIDEAIFGLPVGSLSQIIETDRGYHIIRVVERKNAGRKSFEETQADIKKQMKKDNRNKSIEKYIAELKKKTPIWTIYDDQPGGIDGLPMPKQQEQKEQSLIE